MYGLPKDVDLSLFLNETLVQICFGSNDLILNFHKDVSVMITSQIGLADTDGVIRVEEKFGKYASRLLALLGQDVIKAVGEENGTLMLLFNGGDALYIYDISEHYESYTITYKDKEITV